MRLIQVLVGTTLNAGPHYLQVLDDTAASLDPRVQIHEGEANKLVRQGQAVWIVDPWPPIGAKEEEAPLVPEVPKDPSA